MAPAWTGPATRARRSWPDRTDPDRFGTRRVFMAAVRDRVSALKEKRQTADQIAATVTTELAAKHQVPEKIAGDAARLFYVELP